MRVYTVTEGELYNIISRAMVTALSEDKFLTPSEFFDKVEKELSHRDLNLEPSVATGDPSSNTAD
jgi:hypothetical protein